MQATRRPPAQSKRAQAALFLIALSTLPVIALAQAKSSSDAIADYRASLQDGNPADLNAARGEGLWQKPAGPKNASLKACDLGLGAGVVKGAVTQLPKYFADVGKVMDLESRLVHCMVTLQGANPADFSAATVFYVKASALQILKISLLTFTTNHAA